MIKIATLVEDASSIGQEVTVKGWVRTFRANRFIALNDGSTLQNLQCVVDFENFEEAVLKQINTGAALAIKGVLIASQGKGQSVEIQVAELNVLGGADPEQYPIQPKKHSFEFLREQAHLRVRTNTFSAVMRIRSALAFAVHQFFRNEGFYYVNTPIITGSVAEGAPFVGNTKLLTEKDNILAFATSYEYKANTAYLLTGADLTSGVKRSLQDRLDDFVTVKSFGCLGDGTDQGDKLQRAIDQIFLNSASLLDLTARTTIKIPAGDYVVSNTITLPPYVAIVGDGVENTVIRKSTAGPVFKTVSRQSAIGAPVTFDENTTEANQSNNVSLSNLAIQCASDTAIDLYASRDCEFSNLKITGAWAHSDAYDNNNCGIRMHGNANVTTHNNKFTNIRFENVSFGVYSDFNITSNSIDGCSFYENYIGVAFGW